MRWLAFLLLLAGAAPVSPAQAQPAGQRFVSIAFHDVADRVDELDGDAVTTRSLAQFFDWLKGSGWTAVSLDDIAAAARGTRPLPDKAILITFDDGYRSLYTRVFPLLQVYRFPIVAALVGSWMEGRPDGTVVYGDRIVPRSHFLSWSEAREMQASGLVEFASHSYDLHRGVLANPQGNMVPAAITWRYDPATRRYETDAQYRRRIRADLQRSRQQIAANLGRPPRAIVWPFGRYSGPALAEAKAVGFTFALTLEPEPAYTSDLYAIHRYFPSLNPSLGDLARNLRFDPDYPATRRIACLTLDALATAGPGPAQDAALGRDDRGRAQSRRQHGRPRCPCRPARAGRAARRRLFPECAAADARRPLVARHLAVAHARRRRRVPAPAAGSAAAAVGEAAVPTLFGDMARYTAADGLAMEATAAGRRSRRRPAGRHPRPPCRARSGRARSVGAPGAARLSRCGGDRSQAAPDARLAGRSGRLDRHGADRALTRRSGDRHARPPPAQRGLAPTGRRRPRRLQPAGRSRPAGRGDPPGAAPGRLGLRPLPAAAVVAALSSARRGLLGRHLSLPAVAMTAVEFILLALPQFCFGYPFVMAWYWMAGGLIYYFVHERHLPPVTNPPPIDHWPPISILVPCYNESDNAEETLSAAAAVDYPDFEVIAINDGSRDNTAEVLDRLVGQIPRLRVVHLAKNSGKATALNTGAMLARHEILVCIDGDALLDPQALRWIARVFTASGVGAVAGNPRIRNRTSLLGRLQVGEFSSIIGLIRRAQTVYGRLFTVSGVLCAFRKRALEEAGWWSARTITDDIDVTWRVQLAGWRVIYQPNAIVWILMPETLRGLWKQRLRWAEGGAEMMIDFFAPDDPRRARRACCRPI